MSDGAEHRKDSGRLDDYIRAVRESSRRSRIIIFTLIFACILAFSSYLNALQGSWANDRLYVAQAAAAFWPGTSSALDSGESTITAYSFETLQEGDRKKLLERAQNFVNTLRIRTREEIEDLVRAYHQMRIDNILTVRVPFFGVTYDVNDLGLLAGLTLVILLLTLKFSLSRELENLKLAFEEAEEQNELSACYKIVSMGHVLTTPPPVYSKQREVFWSNLPKLLLALPVVVQLLIVLNDWKTRHIGNAVDEGSTDFSLAVSAVWLVLILLLSYHCVVHLFDIDRLWRRQVARLD